MWGHESILDKNWGGFWATTRRENFRSLSESRAVHPKNPTRGALKRSKIQVWKLSIGIRPQSTVHNYVFRQILILNEILVDGLKNEFVKLFVRNHNKCNNRFQKSLQAEDNFYVDIFVWKMFFLRNTLELECSDVVVQWKPTAFV